MKKPPDPFKFSHAALFLAPRLLLNHYAHSPLLQPHQIKASHHHIFSPFLPNFCDLDPSMTASSWCKHDSVSRSTVFPHKSTGIKWRSTSPMLRAAEFHETSDVDALGIGNLEPLLVSLSKFSSPSWANRPWRSRLVLNILELSHDASTSFVSIVLVPLMFSTPPCAMEAHVDPRSKIICLVIKQKVLLYELLHSNMDLLFVIEVATVREIHGEIDLSCSSKTFIQTAFEPRQIFVFLFLWLYFDVKHQQNNTRENTMMSNDQRKAIVFLYFIFYPTNHEA
ncbi:hypothetical protein Cgig2_012483 [Carnegiea gigantea]|uniref:Uncharacterized protein n=1 Tax=Carnegiea gigantea TaxID=171969 RepID=A0A9Q1K668_9CARY|nr:hypothetical protein Cgig2_012483 [Carnegiea gigantea]